VPGFAARLLFVSPLTSVEWSEITEQRLVGGGGYKKRDQPASVRPSGRHPVTDEVVTRCVCYYLIEKHEILNFHSDLCIEIFSGDESCESRVYGFIYGVFNGRDSDSRHEASNEVARMWKESIWSVYIYIYVVLMCGWRY
jgi:hypothetical protein